MDQKAIRAILATALSAGLLCWAGCDSASNESGGADMVNNPAPGGPSGGGPGGPGPGSGRMSPIRTIMRKIDDRRPGGLTKAIVEGLKPDQPDWPALEKKAGEYLELTSELAKYDPPRGSKEGFTKLATAFHESATELDEAVRAKKRDDAVAASGELSNSCMQCHREHRMMRGGPGGRGGFGPPPGGGPPPDAGPPPGGPPQG